MAGCGGEREAGGGEGGQVGRWPPPPPPAPIDPWRRPFSWLALKAIGGYQRSLSRLWPDICRYWPSCSHYARHAIANRGLVTGILLGTWRILRCHPFAKGGYDPPPGFEEALAKERAEAEAEAGSRDAGA